MEAKYIMTNNYQFIIFPGTINHSDMAKIIKKGIECEIVSAGFISVSNDNITTYGNSESLNLTTKEIDAQIIKHYLFDY